MTVTQDVTATKTWLQNHERLIITVLIILSVLFIGNKILNHQEAKDKVASDAAAQVLQAQQETNKTLAAQIAQTTQQYQALVAQLSQQNAQLAASMQSRTVVLQTQQVADKTIPLPDLGNRWQSLAKLQPGDLTATDNSVSITPEGARSTVQLLEEVPVLQQNLTDSQTQSTNLQTELTASNGLNTQLTQQVAGLNLTLIDQTKACTTEVTTLKAQARKSKAKWFGAGVIVGYIGGLITHVAL